MTTARGNLARKQIFIPANVPEEEIVLRVAAYCRVSTDSDDQINSFTAQNSHYMEMITAHDRWELVDIYADEGITGTSAKKRKDFQRLLADCRNGRIDKVLVKSISRFARNTTECLEAVRELKSLGISIFFEEHNIDDPNKPWNKNMVARILADTRYLGGSGFPVLVDASVFLNTEEKRKKKAPAVQKTEAQTVLRRKCGFRITPHIEHEVLYLLNCLTQNPERIVTPQIHRAHSQRLDTLKSELEKLISQLPVDENRAREVLREIAAEMYADIDPREYETQRLRRLFQKEAPRSELDANLIAMSISAAMVDGNGNVKIRLKNDQIVERGEQNG